MATAAPCFDSVTEIRMIERMTRVPEPYTREVRAGVNLRLTHDESMVLAEILCRVGGPGGSRADLSRTIYGALRDAGYESHDAADKRGEIMFSRPANT